MSAEDQQALSAFAEAHGVSLVPEPGAMAIFLAASALIRRRRRQLV
jgi:hypothetical protein